jgi:hypothetical protein
MFKGPPSDKWVEQHKDDAEPEFIGKPEPATDAVEVKGQNVLLPCPHCGKTPTLHSRPGVNHAGRDWNIHCDTGGCFNYVTEDSRYRSELITMWNRRTTLSVSAGSGSNASSLTQTQEKWELFDVGGIGVRDIQTPIGRIIDVPADKAKLVVEFVNASIDRFLAKKEPSTEAEHVLQMALNTLRRYAGWERNYRPDGVELPMTRPADVQEVEELVKKFLSEHAPKSEGGSEFPQSEQWTAGPDGCGGWAVYVGSEKLKGWSGQGKAFVTGLREIDARKLATLHEAAISHILRRPSSSDQAIQKEEDSSGKRGAR